MFTLIGMALGAIIGAPMYFSENVLMTAITFGVCSLMGLALDTIAMNRPSNRHEL